MAIQTAAAIVTVRVLEKTDDHIVAALPEGKYKLELQVADTSVIEKGKRVNGVIKADIWKVDEVSPGGAYIEPVWGSPRRIQGRVIAIDEAANAVVLLVSGASFYCELRPELYQASSYKLHQHLAVDPFDGVAFEAEVS